MTDSIPAESVIKVDPEGKYVIVFPMRLTAAEMDRYLQTVEDWWTSDKPFLYLDGGATIVKVEKPDDDKAERVGR